jgi:hypothetical protein
MRRKSYQIGLSLALLCFCLLFPPRVAHAVPMFGTIKTTIPGMDCVQDPSGAWGRYYTEKRYFLWVCVSNDDSAKWESNPDCANQQQQ